MLLLFNVFVYIILCIAAENVDGIPNKRYPRVINGEITKITHFPYLVRVDEKHGGFVCGGSIITNTAILTAAHCIDGGNIVVRVGENESKTTTTGSIVDVDRMVIHPSYNPSSLKHDIAVILLKDSLKYDWNVGVIEMARGNGIFPQHAAILGWGCTACIWFIPIWICQLFPPSKELRFGKLVLEEIEEHTFVSRSKVKSCPGDSGGPVIDGNGKLIGIISHLDVFFLRNRPNYFTSVPDHLEWINKIISK